MSPIAALRTGASRRVELLPMTPMQQLRAGHTARRLVQLVIGLWLYGTAMAMFIRAGLGLDPWDVFHYGVQQHVDLSFGTIVIIVGGFVLLLWIPMRQWPGLGTVANVFVIGIATDVMLALLDAPEAMWVRWTFLLGGIVINGLGGALYIGSQYGPGPRDGLMTGLARRTGLSIRLVRTALEVSVLVVGWLLGGVVGVGTVLYALLIGPSVQAFLPLVTVRLTPPEAAPIGARVGSGAGSVIGSLIDEPREGQNGSGAGSVGSAVDGEGEGEHLVDPRPAEFATCDGERPA
ncbi:YczE/YyaS/YitT family protein [Knoellia subterranea]|uniref:Membrane protein n=1 Tax=Knoellia subterranea KCTC 19937 TaxID=1385521 RepID=A0A0A0JR24_9MICO|nr:YitT family protein [Knoellia subterranea]KGN39189.1 membrane protein [Knoellia subterranea KCTC 19937]